MGTSHVFQVGMSLIALVRSNDLRGVEALLKSNPGLINEKDGVSSTKVAHVKSPSKRTSMNRRVKNRSEFGKTIMRTTFK